MRYIVVLTLLGVANWLCAQTPNDSVVAPSQYPTVTLTFRSPEQTPLGQKGTIMLANATCISDGTLFLEIADSPEKMDFTLHSLAHGTEDVSFRAGPMPGYENVSWPLRYFAGEKSVVALVAAVLRKNPMSEDAAAQAEPATLALIYDRKGTLEHVVPIPSNIDAKSIGLYGSGDLLIVTTDSSTKRMRLLVLNNSGDVKNELSLFDRDYNISQEIKKKEPLAKVFDAASFIRIFPHGDNLLLVPQGTAATVIEVNEQGTVRATDLQLPPGYLIQSLLSSDGPSWTVSTYGNAKILNDTASGQGYPVFRTGPIFQFNPLDGSLVRRIDVPEGVAAPILCENGGYFTALTSDKSTGHLEILTGSVPR